MCDINNPIFQNEDSAREYLEAVRWPEGPFCPHCGEAEDVTKLEGKDIEWSEILAELARWTIIVVFLADTKCDTIN